MGFGGRLFAREVPRAVRHTPSRVVEFVAPLTGAFDVLPVDMVALNEPSGPAAGVGIEGLIDLRAAISLVVGGAATCVVLCGFADGRAQLRVARELAEDGVAIEPVVRRGGGGFDIRVKRVPKLDP